MNVDTFELLEHGLITEETFKQIMRDVATRNVSKRDVRNKYIKFPD